MSKLETIADRAWYALHALPRDDRGEAPPIRPLEESNGLYNGVLRKLFEGKSVRQDTLDLVAKALQVPPEWLSHGTGEAPPLTGDIEDRLKLYKQAPPRKRRNANRVRSSLVRTGAPQYDGTEDPYPNRAATLTLAVANGADPKVIMSVASMRCKDGHKLPQAHWLQVLNDAMATHGNMRQMLKAWKAEPFVDD